MTERISRGVFRWGFESQWRKQSVVNYMNKRIPEVVIGEDRYFSNPEKMQDFEDALKRVYSHQSKTEKSFVHIAKRGNSNFDGNVKRYMHLYIGDMEVITNSNEIKNMIKSKLGEIVRPGWNEIKFMIV